MKRILITDDDELLIQMYRKLFASITDTEIVYARSVEESRAKLVAERFDVAVFDVNLSVKGGEGVELVTELRKRSPATVTVLMSTMDDAVTVERCSAAFCFVPKNVVFIPTLRSAVTRALAKSAKAHAA
jgi:DNA-binding NtrC family response regulator